MTARVVSAIPTANTNLAGFGFGAMYPSWLRYPVVVLQSIDVVPSSFTRCAKLPGSRPKMSATNSRGQSFGEIYTSPRSVARKSAIASAAVDTCQVDQDRSGILSHARTKTGQKCHDRQNKSVMSFN